VIIQALDTLVDLLEFRALGDTMPTQTVQKGRVHPDDTTLIEQMEEVIRRLDWLEQKAFNLAVQLDFERDQVIADQLTARRTLPVLSPV
jgi:hypothetical protein